MESTTELVEEEEYRMCGSLQLPRATSSAHPPPEEHSMRGSLQLARATSPPHRTPPGLDDEEEELEEEDFKSVVQTMLENVERRCVVVADRLEQVEKKIDACVVVADRLQQLETKIDFLIAQIAALWPNREH